MRIGRRVAAYSVLVVEEESKRIEGDARLQRELEAVQRSVGALEKIAPPVRDDILRVVDLALQEIWRRAEGADARAATAIQELEDRVELLQRRVDVLEGQRPENGAMDAEPAGAPHPAETPAPPARAAGAALPGAPFQAPVDHHEGVTTPTSRG